MVTYRVRTPDPAISKIGALLDVYEREHASSQTEIYRVNAVSIRIRVIDPRFHGVDRVDREEDIWKRLGELEEEALSDVTMVLVLTPDEVKDSFASYEFDHPLPSRL